MTVDELIERVLKQLEVFYEGRQVAYMKQRKYLVKSIARYGKECERRGWHVQPGYIYKDLVHVLIRLQSSGIEIQYMPALLESAVDRHVNFRAENIRAEAQVRGETPNVVKRSVDGLEKVEIQPTSVEVLAKLYQSIHKVPKKGKHKAEQFEMF